MKTLELKRIALQNWRGLNLDIDFSDKTTISARNEKGKSSIQYAWQWLICGYTDALHPKNYALFDNREELTPDTPKASVKAWILVDGLEYTIEKIAEASFTKSKTDGTYSKSSSDNYTILVDNIEMSATNFNEWLDSNICETKMLPFVLDGSFFAVMCEDDKKKAREILECLCDEVKDEDMEGDYSVLEDLRKKYTIEQIEERTKKDIKSLEERLKLIPKETETKEDFLAYLEKNDFDALETIAKNLRQRLSDLTSSASAYDSVTKPILEKIAYKRSLLSKGRSTHIDKRNALTSEIRAQISSVLESNASIERENKREANEISRIRSEINTIEYDILLKSKERDLLRDRRDEEKEKVFVAEKCAYCGQDLPIDKIEEMRNTFNEQKALTLSNIVEQGKSLKKQIEALTERKETLKEELNNLENSKPKELKSVDSLTIELKNIEATYPAYETTDEFISINAEIAELETQLKDIPSVSTSEKEELMDKIEEVNRTLGLKNEIAKTKELISDLHKEKREVGNQLALKLQILSKCKEYEQEKADIIGNRVNENLCDCKVDMWEIQKNGKVVPNCAIKSNDGVKYATMSGSQKIKAHISLQTMFCKHFKVQMPTFIDEAACFDSFNLPKLTWQHILMMPHDDYSMTVKHDSLFS